MMRREIPTGSRNAGRLATVAMLLLGACSAPATTVIAPPTTTSPAPAELSANSTATAASASTLVGQTGTSPCRAPAEPSPALTEGPYFKPGSPERTSLIEPRTAGEQLVLDGFVFGRDCTPLAGAKLDFWQADGNGVYDNAAYQLRGHQFTDATGAYVLTTVVPGQYPGRTEHIHVKIEPPGAAILTTQLFFPGVEGNQADGMFDPRLVIQMAPTTAGWAGAFDFVVPGP